MKVLSLPELKNRSWICACGNCYAKLEVEFSDLKQYSDQRDGTVIWANCGNCSSRVWINDEFSSFELSRIPYKGL